MEGRLAHISTMGFWQRWGKLVNKISATYDLWQHRRTSRQHLAQLSSHQLKDIGIDPAQREEEIRKYFWQ
ncbi:DUF1127 domain-containing protein [Motilimonas eburnea]|uniref:DUF1127 domain-containing protein n=1 Tax=Motilimonas eburnea TaxID=1737488 RepID=UPI003D801776|nr:DUF1127 domain-containing protein [Motilimonas eburnea]